MRPRLFRSHEEQWRCAAAVSRRSDRELDLGVRPTADPLRAMEITRVARSFMPYIGRTPNGLHSNRILLLTNDKISWQSWGVVCIPRGMPDVKEAHLEAG
jgi:hypothetical protein